MILLKINKFTKQMRNIKLNKNFIKTINVLTMNVTLWNQVPFKLHDP